MTTVAIIQARMSSSRFPGKHLATLADRPMIDHVHDACNIHGIDSVVVATSTATSDDPLAYYCEKRGHQFVRGNLNDPLVRTLHAANQCQASTIVRVTGDCPLADPRLISETVARFHVLHLDGFHYVGVTNSPDGTDVEVFSIAALHEANKCASPDEREHVTTWIRKCLKADQNESDPRWADVHYSVNTVEDLKICEAMLKQTRFHARWQDHVEAYRKIKNG